MKLVSIKGAVAAACGLLLRSALAHAASLTPLDLCSMKPVFMEDFNTLSIASDRLGSARWTAHTPWHGDFGDAAFANPEPNGPFSIDNGMLHITAEKGSNGRWRSGLIAAADPSGQGSGVQYGYFEARMKLPPGAGTWPAFWLSSLKPAQDPRPGIELDVIEYYGHEPGRYSSSVHVWYKHGGTSTHLTHSTKVPDGSLVDGFHTYGVRVAADVLTFYLDRKPVWQVPTPKELTTPLFPMVDLALGSGFPIDQTPNPSVLTVDYVHIYAPTDKPAGQGCEDRDAKDPNP